MNLSTNDNSTIKIKRVSCPSTQEGPLLTLRRQDIYFKSEVEKAESAAFLKSVTSQHIIKTHAEYCSAYETKGLNTFNDLLGSLLNCCTSTNCPYFKMHLMF